MNQSSSSVFFHVFLLLGMCVVSGRPNRSALAQEQLIERVRVEDQEVVEMLKKADRLKEKGFVSEAAKLYLHLLKSHADAAVKKQESTPLFHGVHGLVRERISTWSSKERAEIRDLVKGEAQSLLEKANKNQDQELLKRLAQIYYLTEQGHSAARELANRHFKEGNLRTAVFWWNRLLQAQPELNDPNEIRKRIVSALRTLNTGQEFQKIRSRLKQNGVQLSSEEPQPGSGPDQQLTKSGPTLHNWPRPGGNRTGTGRVPSHLERLGVSEPSGGGSREFIHLWSFPGTVSSPGGLFIPGGNKKNRSSQSSEEGTVQTGSIDLNQNTLSSYRYSPIDPVVYQDTLFLNDSSNVFAFDLKKSITSGWKQSRHLRWSYPESQHLIDGNAVKYLYNQDRGHISLHAYRGHLYFHLQSQLHRIDARTGKQKFKTKAPEIDGERLQFNGTPIVTEQGVFAPLIKTPQNVDVEFYLARFSREEGRLDWLRMIGTSLNTQRYTQQENRNVRTYTHLLSTGNDIYVATNMGMVAALSAITGEVEWVHNYSRYGVESDKKDGWSPGNHSTRGLKPPRIIKGTLYVLPRDNPCFLGFALDSGAVELKHRMPAAVRFLDHGNVKINEMGRSAYFVKKAENGFNLSVLSLNSTQTEETKLDKSASQIPSVSPGERRLIMGRKQKIWGMNRANSYLKFSKKWPWGASLNPHQLITTGNRIILVGPGGVAVLSTLDELDRELWNVYRKRQSPFQFIFGTF